MKISIGIPTYEGGASLVRTLDSIYSQKGFENVNQVIVAVDGKKLSEKIVTKIQNPKLTILYFEKRVGQAGRINDIFRQSQSDFLLLTNDDVVIDKRFLSNTLQVLQSGADMYCCNIQPLKPKSLVEKSLSLRDQTVGNIAGKINKGVNLLRANGRGIILSKNLYKSIELPNSVWNNDAYLYVRAMQMKSKIEYSENLVIYYRLPRKVNEYIRQHAKFAYSKGELQKYFKNDLSIHYSISQKVIFISYLRSFIKSPLKMTGYAILYSGAYLLKGKYRPLSIGYWQTDTSTKKI